MKLTSNKELRDIITEAETRGWVFSKGTRHIKAKHPSGQTATLAVSPSDRRAIMNIKHHLKLRPQT